jgi:RNA polymerase sigma-70 factor (ECF subfamily)
MTADADLAARFQAARPHLGAVAYRMLGSVADAEDAVQEAWLRLTGVDARQVDNLDAWLTTAVARICLNTMRSRRARPPEELVARVPDPIVDAVGDVDPEHQAMLADAVGMALFVILDTLAPPERLAFVLHDVFAIPFDEIAPVVERTPEATRKLASRARQRIQQAAPSPDTDLVAQHTVVDAFFAAGRAGDLDRLVAVLDPGVSLRGDFGPAGRRSLQGASTVAGLARGYAAPEREVHPAVVNGAAGAVIVVDGRVTAIMGFVVRGGRIAAIDVLADAERLARIDLRAVTG